MAPSLFWLDAPRVFNQNQRQKIQPEDRVSLSAVFSKCCAADPAGQ
ncbi:kallikrein-4 [Acetobacter orientalis]|uniref:Kallikrein-4 n=1 Tax=Acetobacter orientalis TaxID=146474 RepID=A0A2Z5ZM40_9PROT|nr:kallikrein-4 [Acetobacter orientalis]